MVVAAVLAFGAGVVIFLYLVPEPHMIGIVVEEYTDKEALIDIAHTDPIAKEILRNSDARGKEL